MNKRTNLPRRTRRAPSYPAAAGSLSIFVLLLASACGPEQTAPPMVVRDSAGITIVENDHTQPAWGRDEVWQLAVTPAIQVGNILEDLDHHLYQAAHSQRLVSGGIVVANTGLSDVRVYDAEGDHVRTLRLTGEESSETARPLRSYQLAADSLLVIGSDGSLLVFDSEGALTRRSMLEAPGTGLDSPPVPIGTFDDGSLLFRAQHSADSTWRGVRRSRMRILHYAPSGNLLGSLGDFDDQTVLYSDREGGYVFGAAAHEATGDSTIWYGSSDRFELREIAADGRTVRLIRLDRPGQRVTGADVFAYRQAAIAPVRGTEREGATRALLDASEFADTFPAYAELIVDNVGNLWVRNYQWFDIGANRAWFVFDPVGRYLGDVITPSRLEIHQIGDDFVLGRMSDRRGAEAVYIYRLDKPARSARAPAETSTG